MHGGAFDDRINFISLGHLHHSRGKLVAVTSRCRYKKPVVAREKCRQGLDMSATANRLEAATLQWINDQWGLLISALDSPDFYPRLAGFLRGLAAADSVVMLSYHRDHAPRVLYESLAPRDRESLYGGYFDGAYLLSPFYLRWMEDRGAAELLRLQEIAPDGFYGSVYYTDYYLASGLRDEVAFLVPINAVMSLLISLGRTEAMQPFCKEELELLEASKSIVSSSVSKHTTLARDSSRGRLGRQLSKQRSNFGSGLLTEQEKRVAQLMLCGHSSKSCARELAISPTTERVHRRNIYAKMRISSQAELFICFFDSLTMEAERPRMELA